MKTWPRAGAAWRDWRPSSSRQPASRTAGRSATGRAAPSASSWGASSRPTRRVRWPATAEPRRWAYTHATQLLRVGVHPKVVSERLGHASIGITLDTYSHVMPGMQEEPAEKIDAGLRKPLAG